MSDLAIGLRVAGSQLESFGHGLVHKFAALNFWTAMLLGGAMVLDRALARRARASWRIALYVPVALRILVPLDWTIQLASTPRLVTFFAPLAQAGAPPAAEPFTLQTPSWYALAAVAYVAVVALLAVRAVVARVRLGRALAGAQPVPDPHPGLPCPVLQHDHLGPMAVGLVAPRIVLPRRLLETGEENALACVLRHEAAHLRRRDAWLSALMQVLAVLAWPVAPMWLAITRVRQLVELACDEVALRGADATERRRYGHALLDIAEWRPLTYAPLGAGELHFGSTLRARIEALASQRHWSPVAQALALSVAPAALLAACSGSASLPAPASANDDNGYGYRFETDSPTFAGKNPTSDLVRPLDPKGRIPPETIQAIVRGHFGAFSACYASGLARDPKLTGVVAVKYVFGEDGIMKEAAEAADEGSTLPDKSVVACIVGEFQKVSYPKGQGNVTVVYPIQFAPIVR